MQVFKRIPRISDLHSSEDGKVRASKIFAVYFYKEINSSKNMGIYKRLYFNGRHDKELFPVSTFGEKHPIGVGGDRFSFCTFLKHLNFFYP